MQYIRLYESLSVPADIIHKWTGVEFITVNLHLNGTGVWEPFIGNK